MKFTTASTLVSNLGERKNCTIDEGGAGFLMSLLSNIYGNSKAAVLREYAANGHDSHVESGTTRPVEVNLPTPLEPHLTVRDFGMGLSASAVETVYSKYGASTKRDSDVPIGGFGIGAKSAFTVSSQFIVTAVRDGERSVTVFSMDDGIPGYTVVLVEPTEEANGVTIQIPVADADIEAWHNEARDVFRTWAVGTVVVNGSAPYSIFNDAQPIVEGLHWTDEKMKSPFLIAVGGVSYAGDWTIVNAMPVQYRELLTRHRAIVTVPIGSVDIRPDREGLRDTPKTVSAITGALDGALEAIVDIVVASVAEATTMSTRSWPTCRRAVASTASA